MPGARNLEENLLLPLQQDLAIVDPARQIHQPVDVDQLLALSPSYLSVGQTARLDFRLLLWWLPSITSGVKCEARLAA